MARKDPFGNLGHALAISVAIVLVTNTVWNLAWEVFIKDQVMAAKAAFRGEANFSPPYGH